MDEAEDNTARADERTLGPTLAAERERQGLSRAEVAQRLHMSPTQVEALERGDYGLLPKGTFLRGFVRNYAKVLGVAADPLLQLLAGTAPREPAPRIIVPTQNIRFDPLGERLSSPYVKAAMLAVVAVAVGFAVMYWAMFVRPKLPAASARRDAAQAPAARPAPTPPAPVIAAAPSVAPTPTTVAPPAGSAPNPASGAPAKKEAAVQGPSASPGAAAPAKAVEATGASAAADKAAGPSKRIGLHFLGESWVEVRDGRGKILFQRLNPAGSEAQIAGRPPLEVVIGNAPEVEMTLDGRPFDLEPHTTVAVARFTLE